MLSFGQLFGSNFWNSFKHQPSESIENLLKQPDCKLEDLLDDADLLQECKNGNKNLIKYLDRERVKELIDLIIEMPETDEHNRGHKYPFVANEVFNCDMQQIIDKFFISPADDVEEEEEPDEQAEAEDANKSDPGFEKDQDESGSDSDEGDFTPEGEEDDNEKKDDDKKEEDSPEETHSEEKETTPTEEKVDEKKDDSEEKKDSSSPSTEEASKEKEDDAKEAEKDAPATDNSQEAASPPTTVEKEEEKKAEETPEKEEEAAETTPVAPQSSTDEDQTTDDASTHVSESPSEAATVEPAEPLSTNKYDLLDYLNTFIDTDEILNDVLSGYFARLLTILIQKKGEEMATYYFKNEHLLYRYAYHSYSKSITDTIIKILDIDISKIDVDEQEVLRIRQEFVRRLLGRLQDHESEESFEYSLNIFQIFNELTFKKAYYTIIIDGEFTNTLKEILLKPESPEWNANAAIRVMNVLISHLRNDLSASTNSQNTPHTFMDDNDEVVLEDNDTKDQEQSQTVEEQLTNHPLVAFFKDQVINYLVAQLDIEPANPNRDYQYADNQPILGKKRLACINLLESLVELDEQSIRERILETDFYTKLFTLFLQFKNNTFLQLHLDNIFHRILKDSNTTADKKVAFLEKLGIFVKLPDFWSENKAFVFKSQREFRHGYLAFTTRFANTLRDLASQSEQATTPETSDAPETTSDPSPLQQHLEKQSWQDFVTNDVTVYNELNAINLANRGAARKDSEEFDEFDDDKFKDMEERDDIDDDDDKEDEYSSNRNSMRQTLQEYDADKAREEHENDYIGDNIEKDEEEDNLFSGLNSRAQDDDSDDDKPIGGTYDDSSDDSENEKEDVSENSNYYDNSFWNVNQYSIEDLLQE